MRFSQDAGHWSATSNRGSTTPSSCAGDERWLNADAFVTFALDADGEIREARMEPISPLTDFSFDFQDLRLTPVEKE